MERKRRSRKKSVSERKAELNTKTGLEYGVRKCGTTTEVAREAAKKFTVHRVRSGPSK